MNHRPPVLYDRGILECRRSDTNGEQGLAILAQTNRQFLGWISKNGIPQVQALLAAGPQEVLFLQLEEFHWPQGGGTYYRGEVRVQKVFMLPKLFLVGEFFHVS